MSKIDINICSCTSDCSELELLATNKKDNTKENLLEVAENPDLLEVKTGVPTSDKTKLFPKRDETKVDKEDFESFKDGFNEFELKHDKEIKVLKREDTVLREKLRDKVNTTDLPDFNSFATKEELSDKVNADSLPDFSRFATNEELNKKTNIEKLEEYATKLELEDKANTTDLPDFDNFATKEDLKIKVDKGDFEKQLEKKLDKSDLSTLNSGLKKIDVTIDFNLINQGHYKVIEDVDVDVVNIIDGTMSIFNTDYFFDSEIIQKMEINKRPCIAQILTNYQYIEYNVDTDMGNFAITVLYEANNLAIIIKNKNAIM